MKTLVRLKGTFSYVVVTFVVCWAVCDGEVLGVFPSLPTGDYLNHLGDVLCSGFTDGYDQHPGHQVKWSSRVGEQQNIKML